ncbi:MAG: hypothetical protein M4579_002792 [Chaenotheca gracillima]|nr:MAG: hypothetical protein M4579_002792 [Chaenotheca gracillima]
MSYLQKQVDAFKSDLSSSSAKLSAKRSLAPPAQAVSTTSSPGSSQTSPSKNETKRKRPESGPVVYSQPADTGTGNRIMTQVTYAVEHLKAKEIPQTLSQIINYLSVQSSPKTQRNIAMILQRHDRVEYNRPEDKDARWDSGTYRYRPLHDIRSSTKLLSVLQNQPTAQGLSVRELKDGWLGADASIDELEGRQQVLVTRNKKDNHARMVWANDPSLSQHVEPEFQALFHKVKLPSKEDTPRELSEAGLKPTSEDPRLKMSAPTKGNNRKQKRPRRGGRTTNTHMLGVLRDFSSTRK